MAKMVKCKTCGEEIAKSAKVCPHCGARQKKRVFLGIVLFIIGISLFSAGINGFNTSSTSQNSSDTQKSNSVNESKEIAQPKEDEPENKPTISMAEFEAISTGMTYEEVVEIIGSDGELLSEVYIGAGEEYKTVMYSWKGEGSIGANANITFQGGKVTAKAQIGLK